MGCYPMRPGLPAISAVSGRAQAGSHAAQKAEFTLQALDLALQAAYQPERLPVHRMLPAVLLKTAQFIERIIVENQFDVGPRAFFAKDAEPAVIPEHLRMHARSEEHTSEL